MDTSLDYGFIQYIPPIYSVMIFKIEKMFEFSTKETIQIGCYKTIIDDGNGNIWIGTNSKAYTS